MTTRLGLMLSAEEARIVREALWEQYQRTADEELKRKIGQIDIKIGEILSILD